MIGTFSPTIARISHFSSFLGEGLAICQPNVFSSSKINSVAGWGRKTSGKIAIKMSKKYKIPYMLLEDGFLRSIKLGTQKEYPLSIVVDLTGIYYDATAPSDLECIIAEGSFRLFDLENASKAISLLQKHHLSKYNEAPDIILTPSDRKRVLVIDQTANDLSIELGMADESTFERMLEDAVNENPDAEILVKIHPEVFWGKKSGILHHYFDRFKDQITVLTENVNPLSLIEQVDKVYVVTSQVGFEALMYHRTVYCYGVPWYAGWGLTNDRNKHIEEVISRRGKCRTVEELFAAAYLKYARYIDPQTGEKSDIFSVIHFLILKKELMKSNQGHWFAIGAHQWKHNAVSSFLYSPNNKITYYSKLADLPDRIEDPKARFLIWGDRFYDQTRFKYPHIPICRMEDGFLRSIGLGSDHLYPVSLVVDSVGIYYDPTQPSDLENHLNKGDFTEEELNRAAQLRQRLVDLKLTKYNLEGQSFTVNAQGRRVIFVPGQVETDASIHYGCRSIRTDIELLRAVRGDNPDAFILYKPHPDVVSGNRKNRSKSLAFQRLCDLIVIEANVIDCIEAADEVHTMTSLTGFEALLRQRKVVCYGLPFYAGWGLTIDLLECPRRNRQLLLDELIAGTLIRYARYVNPETGEFISVEAAVQYLEQQRKANPVRLVASSKPSLWTILRHPKSVWRNIKKFYAN